MLLTKIKIFSEENIIIRLCSEMHVHVEILNCRANGSTGGLSHLRIESESTTTADDIKNWFRRSNTCGVVSIAAVSPGIWHIYRHDQKCPMHPL